MLIEKWNSFAVLPPWIEDSVASNSIISGSLTVVSGFSLLSPSTEDTQAVTRSQSVVFQVRNNLLPDNLESRVFESIFFLYTDFRGRSRGNRKAFAWSNWLLRRVDKKHLSSQSSSPS